MSTKNLQAHINSSKISIVVDWYVDTEETIEETFEYYNNNFPKISLELVSEGTYSQVRVTTKTVDEWTEFYKIYASDEYAETEDWLYLIENDILESKILNGFFDSDESK